MTGFEPFGAHSVNPTEGLAKAIDEAARRRLLRHGRGAAGASRRHREPARALLAETNPEAILHLGLAAGRARVALEQVAINAMDYEVPDNAGYRAKRRAVRPEAGRLACFSTLPLPTIVKALVDEGIPAYVEHGRHVSLQSDPLLDAPRGPQHASPATGRLHPLPAAAGDGRGHGTGAGEHGLSAHAPGGRDRAGCNRPRRWPSRSGVRSPSTST